ncbi:hypothetical protein [Desulfuribacillus alkaliarsenatis]|uniref:Uncharacterized protein n=1 Tax=Desulfuribacillus alkaliarsenatis TaxID=766136 RepID=A0A1E5FYI0_9FIRM|nr:hypothetical protein [Desulfuribacillus alkaliarsenatis]OEF95634.1 hypothetical protein BHF68_12380 [Desulfuribacillus alkaliarsenatis]
MAQAFGFVFLYIVIAIFELPPLYGNKRWKEMGIYLTVWSIGITLIMLISFGIAIPSPAEPLERFIVMIFGL